MAAILNSPNGNDRDQQNPPPEPPESPKGPEIVMPEERRAFLEIKLREYETRLKTFKELHRYKAPEDPVFAGTHYKMALVKALLRDGKVNTWTLQRQMEQEFGSIITARYQNACAVVADYCNTGGKNVHRQP